MNFYDAVQYPSYAYALTHPDHLAVVATLLGLAPPSSERCRVLEIGCGAGGNIVPMALDLPESQFLGIDTSAVSIDAGHGLIAGVGLKNVELRVANILDLDQALGQFDYIVSHGVYSWVPPQTREKLLDIYRDNLAPGGIGYISFNALPGWHMRGMLRDMMLCHVKTQGVTAAKQSAAVREFLDFLVQGVEGNSAYGLLLREEQAAIKQATDGYIAHDYLEPENNAFYFLEFCQHLKTKNLRFLGDAKFSTMSVFHWSVETTQTLLRYAPDVLAREQYLDFLRKRVLRQCLVVHDQIEPVYALQPNIMERFQIASAYVPSGTVDFADNVSAEFIGPKGKRATTGTPIVKAAMCCLADAWPQFLSFQELCRQASLRLGAHAPGPRADADVLQSVLLATFANDPDGMIDLRLRPLRVANKIDRRPVASALARLQATRAEGEPIVNLRHESVHLPSQARKLLGLLDGTRERSDLIDAMLGILQHEELSSGYVGQARSHDSTAVKRIEAFVDEWLHQLLRCAFLMPS